MYESPLCDSRTKAIRLWSGDQAGSESLNGPVGSEIAGNPTLEDPPEMVEVERLAGAGHVRRAFDAGDEENRRFRGRGCDAAKARREHEKTSGVRRRIVFHDDVRTAAAAPSEQKLYCSSAPSASRTTFCRGRRAS